MSGVQGFINGRHSAQQGHTGSPRQAAATLFKVPVPPTKLAYSESRSNTSGLAFNLPNGQPLAGHNARLTGSKAAQSSSGPRDGFDTDAESLEDTTIMSLGDDSRNGNQLRRGSDQAQSTVLNPESHLPHENGQNQRPSAQRLDQLEFDDPAMEGEGEGEGEVYSESGDEEDDEGGEDGPEEQSFSNADYMQFSNPELQLFRERTPGFKHVRLQDVLATASPSLRNIILSNPQKYQLAENPLPSRTHSRRSSPSESDAYQARSDQISKRRPAQQVQPETFQEGRPSSEKQPMTSAQSSASNGTKSERQRSTQPTADRKPLYIAQLLPFDRTDSTRGVNGTVADNSNDSMISSPSQHKATSGADGPGAPRNNAVQLHNGDEKAASISNGDRSPQSPPQHDEIVDVLQEQTSTKPLEDTQTRKRTRDLDYSPDQLSNKTYEQLRTEPFDHDPRATAPTLPHDIANTTLVQKLDHMLGLRAEHETKASQRTAIFASLPIEQHEDCGDLILERFTAIVAKFKDARRERRSIASEFEDEVARREEMVRGKMSTVENDLGRLRRGGEEVVKGKKPLS